MVTFWMLHPGEPWPRAPPTGNVLDLIDCQVLAIHPSPHLALSGPDLIGGGPTQEWLTTVLRLMDITVPACSRTTAAA